MSWNNKQLYHKYNRVVFSTKIRRTGKNIDFFRSVKFSRKIKAHFNVGAKQTSSEVLDER